LFDEIKNELKNNGSYNKVELTGWISHDELPKYLNELKLIIAPSYTEGGVPAVIMEAMACGIVSLVTPVAGVDIIKDGESGFILEDNSPECIAKNVIRALEHTNLDEIVNNACNLVEEEFSYETEVRRYRDMIYRMLYNQE
jgi:glycosyltransferase involved in cell wall biosynthesis